MANMNDNEDLRDSSRDQERLKPETASLDLPEVHDIPGQEHIAVMPLGELADVTASSDDEEGRGILDNLNELQQPNVKREVADARNEANEDISTDADYRGDSDAEDLDEGELARFESGDR